MAMVALANAQHHLHDMKKPRQGARKMLMAQAKFLMNQQAPDGSFADGYALTDGGVEPDPGPKTLHAQASAIRGLLAAYQYGSKSDALLNAAERAYAFMNESLWSEQAGTYRAAVGANRSTYNGYNFGATLGALRELAIVREGDARAAVVDRLDRFFEKVGQRSGLQLAEIGHTGEPIPSLAEREKMMQKMKSLMHQDPAKARQMKRKMADSDSDGVPKPPFVAGTKHGAAPVQAESVTLETP